MVLRIDNIHQVQLMIIIFVLLLILQNCFTVVEIDFYIESYFRYKITSTY